MLWLDAVDALRRGRRERSTADPTCHTGRSWPKRRPRDDPGRVLDDLFGQLPQHFRSEQARGFEAVIECRVDLADGDRGRYQIRIEGGRCSVGRGGTAEPDVVVSIPYDDLVAILAQAATASRLFLQQRLVVRGDLLLVTRLPSLFRMPTVESRRLLT